MELVLSVKRSQFRVDDVMTDVKDKVFAAVRPKILERDRHACVYCRWQALKYQEVHHLDDDHGNNDEANLVTTCALCHLCNHIGFAGAKGAAVLIYLDPELQLTQVELNVLVRILWLAEGGNDVELRATASGLLMRLMAGTAAAKQQLGSADPAVLGSFLLGLDDDQYAGRKERLKGVYLLPVREAFKSQLSFWKAETMKSLPASSWVSEAIEKLKERVGEVEDGVPSPRIADVLTYLDTK